MKKLFIGLLIVFSSIISHAQSMDELAIRKVLDNQVIAWNAGNVDEFMKTYWQNNSLIFIGKSGITYGWQSTLENYKKHYPDTAAMGHLTFVLLEFNHLSPVYYFVLVKWHLQRSIGNIEGYFTLLFKILDYRKIVLSHPRTRQRKRPGARVTNN